VIAVVAIANGHTGLIIFSLVISIPLVLAGSQILLSMIQRFPVIVWLGAGLLGWVAGEIMSEDPHLVAASRSFVSDLQFIVPGTNIEIGILPLAGAASVLLIGLLLQRLDVKA
jgi:predicted tellurium resistance membrane protein TerC